MNQSKPTLCSDHRLIVRRRPARSSRINATCE